MNNSKPNSSRSAEAKQRNATSSVRLLLHAVDGAIPYLTPSLCRRCFPADQVADVLVIGISVRDTCLVPVFEDEKNSNRKTVSCSKIKVTAAKPRGYTFSAAVKLDKYMLAYERVTVPTFDLYQDAASCANKKKDPLDVGSFNLPSASHCVHLWTANGRQQITPKEYAACAASLGSALAVPLFDMLPPVREVGTGIEEEDVLLQKRRTKRIHAITQRNQQWTMAMDGFHHGRLLTPVAVSVDADATPETVQWVAEEFSSTSGIGIAIVGLQYVQDSARRLNMLRSLLNCRLATSPMTFAALSTTTTLQVVELLRISQINNCVVMIGTELPRKWAQSKKAFLCDFLHKHPLDASSGKRKTEPGRIMDHTVPAYTLDHDGCFDLNTDDGVRVDEHPWFRDSTPIVPGCQCVACTSYSRSYLYHLVCSQELLAETLLFIHNLHHLLSLLRAFQSLLSENDTDAATAFCDAIQAQCSAMNVLAI